jgi:molybdopterin/thiamine biosynthesis adenylyltransferase
MVNLYNQDIANFLNNLGSSDLQSFINILEAYSDNCFRCNIIDFGFNMSSGNVYIVLDNDITITSCFGQSVDYVVTDPDDDTDVIEFSNYQDCVNYMLGN